MSQFLPEAQGSTPVVWKVPSHTSFFVLWWKIKIVNLNTWIFIQLKEKKYNSILLKKVFVFFLQKYL